MLPIPKRIIRWASLLGFVLLMTLTACDGLDSLSQATDTPIMTQSAPTATMPVMTEPAPTPTMAVSEQLPEGQAYIESLDVIVLDSTQVQATVSGNLSDGCTTLEGINVQHLGVTFVFDLITSYSDTIGCIQALVPFQETVLIDSQDLAAGTYTVAAGSLNETFTLSTEVPQPTPDLVAARVSVSPNSVQSGDIVTLTGNAFPPGVAVEIGLGRVNSEYDTVANTQTGTDGTFVADVVIPDFVEPDSEWVFVADVNNAKVITDPIVVTSESGTGGIPEDGVNEPVNGLFNQTYIYLIAQEDNGQSGPLVGCNDSIVPVIIEIEPTIAPMTAAINRLLSLNDPFYGQSGLYNALSQSELTLEGINIVNGEAIINLTGTLQLAGVCDDPRVLAQLEYTALQYHTVDAVTILLNGQSLASQLGG